MSPRVGCRPGFAANLAVRMRHTSEDAPEWPMVGYFGTACASVTPNRRLSVAAGFGDRDLDVAGLDLVRFVVAGDRERRMCRQQNVLAHVRFVSGVVLEELGHGVGGDGPA